ncbi:MAG: six-cysteine ranthipeptide SCIFF [Eubacterium sp.]|nr:six-cysteine ranthipeptide SCIFF [Eubacterium sp.]
MLNVKNQNFKHKKACCLSCKLRLLRMCQSASKTSCSIANQQCEKLK